MSPFFEAVLLSLVEEISFSAAQIDNLRTAVSVFLLNRALLNKTKMGMNLTHGKLGFNGTKGYKPPRQSVQVVSPCIIPPRRPNN